MKLIDIYPKDLLCERVSIKQISFTEYGFSEIDKIVELKKSCMFELGGNIWDKHVQDHPKVNKMSLAHHFQIENPNLYKEISKLIGYDTIKDILYVYSYADDKDIDYKKFSELLIAEITGSILHISDVEFSNPLEPLKVSERISPFQEFRGLNLFGELISRSEAYCKEHGLGKICLTAAHISLIPLFEKNGFVVDDTPTGKQGMACGISIPMTKVIKE